MRTDNGTAGPHLPYVRPEMRTASFWTARLPSDAGRSRENAQASVRGGVRDITADGLFDPPLNPPAEAPSGYHADGRPWSERDWEGVLGRLLDALALPALPAFIVRRAALRTWPTDRPAFRASGDREFDQFQETGLHLMEPVRILAESRDRAWLRVASRIASGWVAADALAVADDTLWGHLAAPETPLVVVAPGVFTQPQPYDAEISARPLEFGAYLPVWPERIGVGGQNPAGQVVIGFPVRNRDGRLELRPALVRDDGRVRTGFLPWSRKSLLEAVFTQLGDRYDWGDRMGRHDCSSLVMDAYRTVGVAIPRNSSDQRRYLFPRTEWQKADDRARRLRDLAEARPGDLLHMPGHVLCYLGMVEGRPYAIHAFVGYGETDGNSLRSVLVNAVEVSAVDMPTRPGVTFLEALTAVCRLF